MHISSKPKNVICRLSRFDKHFPSCYILPKEAEGADLMKINTVLGLIDTSELGPTLMHEHILIASPTMCRVCPDWYDRTYLIDYAVRMLKRVKAHGLRTIVDMTAFQLGRDVSLLCEVAEKAEINIIACTGYYWYDDACLVDKSPEYLAEIMIRDIEKGMEGGSAKAGVIKACTDKFGLSPFTKRYLKAACIAHKATGVPISTHTNCHYGPQGKEQQEFFESEGVDLRNVLIGHMGDLNDIDYASGVASRGSFICLDRFGVSDLCPGYIEDEFRCNLAAKLFKSGWEDHVVFSHDASCFIDFSGREMMGSPWEYTSSYTRGFDLENHCFQFDLLFRRILPWLRERGVTERQLNKALITNPRRFFEGIGN